MSPACFSHNIIFVCPPDILSNGRSWNVFLKPLKLMRLCKQLNVAPQWICVSPISMLMRFYINFSIWFLLG